MQYRLKTLPPPTAGLRLADTMRWRWASASEIGTSHLRLGTRKQDAVSCFLAGPSHSIFCAIVSDGAGSASFGGQGASISCRTLSTAIRAYFNHTSACPNDDDVWSWIYLTRDRLAIAAENRGVARKAFASTLILFLAASDQQLIVHVGDGAVVGRTRDGGWKALSWPENGEYASTTYFLTDDPAPQLRLIRSRLELNGIALFSDGIEDLALDLKAMAPHDPFFRTMLAPLDKLEVTGKCASLSQALGTFLSGSRVCDRTDDDKSLILASSL